MHIYRLGQIWRFVCRKKLIFDLGIRMYTSFCLRERQTDAILYVGGFASSAKSGTLNGSEGQGDLVSMKPGKVYECS